jgi:allantoate deiminase
MQHGPLIMQQAETLGALSESADHLTRTYLTPMAKRAGDHILDWMREAGMQAEWDTLGNVVGRYLGTDGEASKVLMTGSHMDSVVNAGKYDGVFGVLSPIACVRALHARGERLPFTFEIVAFGDEEGVRFGVTLIGSKAMAGRFDPTWWDKTDAAGITLRQAVKDFGGDPTAVVSLSRDPARYLGFIESHIEQGPVLLNEGRAVGVVTSIAGASRVRAKVIGLAGHAGTVPMPGRQDALAAAAEMALAVEAHCAKHADSLVGTVGKFEVAGGGAVNVIPGEVHFTVDVRSADDAKRRAAVIEMNTQCAAIGQRRKVQLGWDAFFELNAAPCDANHQAQWAQAIAAQGLTVRHLPSGAGHDAMSFKDVLPLSMLFVRCGNGGISHNPLETMTAEDAEVATQTMLHFLQHFGKSA